MTTASMMGILTANKGAIAKEVILITTIWRTMRCHHSSEGGLPQIRLKIGLDKLLINVEMAARVPMTTPVTREPEQRVAMAKEIAPLLAMVKGISRGS